AGWASPDFPAIASYLRLGMLPLTQMLGFVGEPRDLGPSSAEIEPLDLALACDIDRQVLGREREMDHRLWLEAPGTHGWHIGRGGYVYERDDGWIGPVAWLHDGLAAPLLRHAFACAAARGVTAHLATSGLNHQAISLALEHG